MLSHPSLEKSEGWGTHFLWWVKVTKRRSRSFDSAEKRLAQDDTARVGEPREANIAQRYFAQQALLDAIAVKDCVSQILVYAEIVEAFFCALGQGLAGLKHNRLAFPLSHQRF